MTSEQQATSDQQVPAWREVLTPHLVDVDPSDKHWSPRLHDESVPVSALPTPSLTLDVDIVQQNLAAMTTWCAEQGVDLAPHGKTTMSPALWHWQLAAGCRAISVANGFQARIARRAGIPRVVIANEVISVDALTWLGSELATTAAAEFDVVCWADSVAGVERMTAALAAAGLGAGNPAAGSGAQDDDPAPAPRRLGVCLEFGAPGARTGVRSAAVAREVAAAVHASPVLELRGVAGYEGSVTGADPAARLAAIREYLAQMRALFLELAPTFETDAPVLSAGGSECFDLVAEAFAGIDQDVSGARALLRSGAYLVHDHGHYAHITPAVARGAGPHLDGAVTARAQVLSTPELGLALLDAGKRDVPYDIHLPTVLRVERAGVELALDPNALTLTGTNDQHAYVEDPEGLLAVGDIATLGLSHPCTMFDKWRTVLLTERGAVLGALPTFF
ncbi:alanine racemase [Bogoriella caseilytica]|nr:alanine racemase [Bogoriella caseilytica]